jgi:violaxanthin de-epoxidase
MDLHQTPLLDAFTECSLTDHACYPPLVADPRYPPLVHDDVAEQLLWQSNLLPSSEPTTTSRALQNLFTGKWYLSAGLNPVFDTFDCQVHEFSEPKDAINNVKNGGVVVPIADATFSYRVQVNDNNNNNNKWFTRTGDKRLTLVNEDSTRVHDGKWRGFDQGLKWGMDSFLDHENHDPGLVHNRPAAPNNNDIIIKTKSPRLVLTLRPDLMNYKDDWVVLQSSPEYIVVLYRGTNSAWEGYGGLNVYTRTRTISDTLKRGIERGLRKVNLSLRDLTIVDNSCPKE